MMDPDFLKRCDDGMTTQAPTRPWTVKRTSIYGANGQLVFVAAPMTTDGDSALAASAPNLLALLTDARQVVSEHLEMCGPCDHSVNICVCGLRSQLDDIDSVLETVRVSRRL